MQIKKHYHLVSVSKTALTTAGYSSDEGNRMQILFWHQKWFSIDKSTFWVCNSEIQALHCTCICTLLTFFCLIPGTVLHKDTTILLLLLMGDCNLNYYYAAKLEFGTARITQNKNLNGQFLNLDRVK